jgi:hypothetical protein
MDHLAQATTDHNMQYAINLTATAKLPPLNGHGQPARKEPGLTSHTALTCQSG